MAASSQGRSRDRPPAGRGGRADRRTALALRLAHEIGNLLAAIRLEAHLIDAPGGAELQGTRERLEALALDAGALLAQVRSLLGGASAGTRVSPESILASLVGAFEEPVRARLDVEAPAQDAADAALAADAEGIYQLLLVLTRRALEVAGSGGRVALSVALRRGRVVFELEAQRPGVGLPPLLPPSLATLLPAVAELLGGRLVLDVGGSEAAARLSLPRDGDRARLAGAPPAPGGS